MTTMTSEDKTKMRAAAAANNGVDSDTLFATINAVRDQRELATFQWRASNKWVKGTHSRTTIEGFSGAGADHDRKSEFQYDADHPPVLVGEVPVVPGVPVVRAAKPVPAAKAAKAAKAVLAAKAVPAAKMVPLELAVLVMTAPAAETADLPHPHPVSLLAMLPDAAAR